MGVSWRKKKTTLPFPSNFRGSQTPGDWIRPQELFVASDGNEGKGRKKRGNLVRNGSELGHRVHNAEEGLQSGEDQRGNA